MHFNTGYRTRERYSDSGTLGGGGGGAGGGGGGSGGGGLGFGGDADGGGGGGGRGSLMRSKVPVDGAHKAVKLAAPEAASWSTSSSGRGAQWADLSLGVSSCPEPPGAP